MADCEILFSVPRKVRTRTAVRVCKVGLTPTSRNGISGAGPYSWLIRHFQRSSGRSRALFSREVQKIRNLWQEPSPNVRPLSLITATRHRFLGTSCFRRAWMEGCLAASVGPHTRIRLRRAQAGSAEVECGLRSQAQKRLRPGRTNQRAMLCRDHRSYPSGKVSFFR